VFRRGLFRSLFFFFFTHQKKAHHFALDWPNRGTIPPYCLPPPNEFRVQPYHSSPARRPADPIRVGYIIQIPGKHFRKEKNMKNFSPYHNISEPTDYTLYYGGKPYFFAFFLEGPSSSTPLRFCFLWSTSTSSIAPFSMSESDSMSTSSSSSTSASSNVWLKYLGALG